MYQTDLILAICPNFPIALHLPPQKTFNHLPILKGQICPVVPCNPSSGLSGALHPIYELDSLYLEQCHKPSTRSSEHPYTNSDPQTHRHRTTIAVHHQWWIRRIRHELCQPTDEKLRTSVPLLRLTPPYTANLMSTARRLSDGWASRLRFVFDASDRASFHAPNESTPPCAKTRCAIGL